jgi:hypothetical protein
MAQFRKKPVVIEASQWFKLGQHPAVLAAPLQPIDGYIVGTHGWIQTLEGGHIVTPGDWIITGVKGEHYPCKPDIFAATYESADATPAEGAQSQDAKDARRYRWLREFNPTFVAVEMLGASLIGINSKSDGQAAMDSAIDAAIERSDKGSDAGRKE